MKKSCVSRLAHIPGPTRLLELSVIWLFCVAGVCEMVPRSEPIEFGDVPGAYGATFRAGRVDSLWLRADSTWVRKYETWDGRSYLDSGEYLFKFRGSERDRRRRDINLYNFVMRFNADSADTNCPLSGSIGVADSIPAFWFASINMNFIGYDTIVCIGDRWGANWRKITNHTRKKP